MTLRGVSHDIGWVGGGERERCHKMFVFWDYIVDFRSTSDTLDSENLVMTEVHPVIKGQTKCTW